jgi:RNA polymerase sigma factor (TIGR02999 family)
MDSDECITLDDLKNLIVELRAMARRLLHLEKNPQSLTPTALAMSALRRAKAPDVDWADVRFENRRHFFAVLSMTMRHALIDHARRARAKGRNQLSYLPWDDKVLQNLPVEAEERPARFIALDEGLAKLKEEDLRSGEVIELRFFAGCTIPEIAVFYQVSEKTVDRWLDKARTKLGKILKDSLLPS